MTASSMEGVATSTEAGNGMVCSASRLLPSRLLGLPLVGPSLQCISSIQPHAHHYSVRRHQEPAKKKPEKKILPALPGSFDSRQPALMVSYQ